MPHLSKFWTREVMMLIFDKLYLFEVVIFMSCLGLPYPSHFTADGGFSSYLAMEQTDKQNIRGFPDHWGEMTAVGNLRLMEYFHEHGENVVFWYLAAKYNREDVLMWYVKDLGLQVALNQVIEGICNNDNVQLVDWTENFFASDCSFGTYGKENAFLLPACRLGALKILQSFGFYFFVREVSFKLGKLAVETAARYGHVNILDYLFCGCNYPVKEIFPICVENDDMELLYWLHRYDKIKAKHLNDYDWSSTEKKVTQWLIKNGFQN